MIINVFIENRNEDNAKYMKAYMKDNFEYLGIKTPLRKELEKIELPIDFGISELEVNGFVLRVLGNLTQNIEFAMSVCHNYVRKNFLGSKDLVMRKY